MKQIIKVSDYVSALPIEETIKKELQKLITRNERVYYIVGIGLGLGFGIVYGVSVL